MFLVLANTETVSAPDNESNLPILGPWASFHLFCRSTLLVITCIEQRAVVTNQQEGTL